MQEPSTQAIRASCSIGQKGSKRSDAHAAWFIYVTGPKQSVQIVL